MDEFLKNNYSLLTKSVEILAAVAGIIAWRKYRQTPVRYFILFLFYVVFIEIVGYYTTLLKNIGREDILEGTLIQRNYWWYTLMWTIGSSLFYLFFYRKVLQTDRFKIILKYIALIFLAIIIGFYAFNFETLFSPRPFFISVMNALVIMSCTIFYFMEILVSERILNFPRSAVFFISATIFVWFLINTPLTFYIKYHREADPEFVLLRYKIKLFSNIFMYLIFAFALLWCKPQND